MSSKHFPFLSTIVTITVAIYAEIAKGPGKRIPKLLILIIILYHQLFIEYLFSPDSVSIHC